MSPNVLIVDDNRDILAAARIALAQTGFSVTTGSDPEQIPALMAKTDFQVILLDMNFTRGVVHGEEGLTWLQKIRENDPAAVVILITAYGDVELAVRAMQNGAYDFIQKPWDNEKLVSTVSMAVELGRSKREVSLLKRQNQFLSECNGTQVIGSGPAMRKVLDLVEKVSRTDANVLITGENGTGKDLIARLIHDSSERSDAPFLPVDMGAIPESLFESEMFGYERGAFTGADKSRIGRIEAASGGTLFLDEIGNIPLAQQPKLLRVLETRELVSLGGVSRRAFDIRLICATNSDIQKLIEDNRFRQDLLYRINTVEIPLPSLRERKEDIPELLDHFLQFFCRKYKRPDLKITPSLMERLTEFPWPGNVRELKHLVERAVILAAGSPLKAEDFSLRSGVSEKNISNFNLENREMSGIAEAIDASEGNLSRAAELLGISRATLYRKMEKYGL
ncbi:sigma-54-dependent transcriptional regulator [Spirochaeta isovalerica]|uniref:DNA-binding NtrC family response regulator n=1 Tax=Spirochaeta isovalerica TaxID=150 RepID=A0A841R9R5_9SPIO|nr:sigma-54 dependent transcriptional regulator [Spirochaeta isovalerica]MBB6479669.1 DNA-binding NtrC family response regulator [Spirochaeta isovalerica]